MELKDLKQDKRNYRKHNDRNISLIRKSVDECGYGRSVVVNKDNEIICGNGLVSSISKDTKIKVVETNGDELIVVKRKDLKTGDEKQIKLGIYDNSTSDSSEFDMELLKMDFNIEELGEFGIDLKNGTTAQDLYTSRVNIPQYEVKNENITLEDCLNKEKVKNLVEEIKSSNVSDEEKEFLINASMRHLLFNYRNIAEYYAKASKEMQELMEKSALVIIDYDDALKNGYTELTSGIESIKDEG